MPVIHGRCLRSSCGTVTIRLAPVLPTTVAVAQFPNVKKATEAVIDIMNRGVGIRKCLSCRLSPTRNSQHAWFVEIPVVLRMRRTV